MMVQREAFGATQTWVQSRPVPFSARVTIGKFTGCFQASLASIAKWILYQPPHKIVKLRQVI